MGGKTKILVKFKDSNMYCFDSSFYRCHNAKAILFCRKNLKGIKEKENENIDRPIIVRDLCKLLISLLLKDKSFKEERMLEFVLEFI